MSRRSRPVPLTPLERMFQFDQWVQSNLPIVEWSGPEILTACPRCGREKLAINTAIKGWHCLYAGCGFAGWVPAMLIREIRHCTVAQAEDEMRTFAMGVAMGPLPRLNGPGAAVRGELPSAPFPPYTALTERHRAYLEGQRGVPTEHLISFGVRSIVSRNWGGKGGYMLHDRILLPAYVEHRAVYWTARGASLDRMPKTVNMPRACRVYGHPPECACTFDDWGLTPVPFAADGSEVVLGVHLVTPGKPVIVVEGDMDALVCGPGFVATYGAHCTHDQAALIAKTGASEAIVLFDGDVGGEKAKRKAADHLSRFMNVRVATCPWGADPGSLGRRAAIEVAMSAPAAGSLDLPRVVPTTTRPHVAKLAFRSMILRNIKES